MRKMRKKDMLGVVWDDAAWLFDRERYLEVLKENGFSLDEVMLAEQVLEEYQSKFDRMYGRVMVSLAWLFDFPMVAVKKYVPLSTAYRWRDELECMNKTLLKARVVSFMLPDYCIQKNIDSNMPSRKIVVDTLIGRQRYVYKTNNGRALIYRLDL